MKKNQEPKSLKIPIIHYDDKTITCDTSNLCFFFHREPPPLQTHNNSNIILRLPGGKRIKDIKWLSVWCRRFTVSETYRISFFTPFLHTHTHTHACIHTYIYIIHTHKYRYINVAYEKRPPTWNRLVRRSYTRNIYYNGDITYPVWYVSCALCGFGFGNSRIVVYYAEFREKSSLAFFTLSEQ